MGGKGRGKSLTFRVQGGSLRWGHFENCAPNGINYTGKGEVQSFTDGELTVLLDSSVLFVPVPVCFNYCSFRIRLHIC